MDFALIRNAHKKSMSAMRGLVNPADARGLIWLAHNSLLAAVLIQILAACLLADSANALAEHGFAFVCHNRASLPIPLNKCNLNATPLVANDPANRHIWT